MVLLIDDSNDKRLVEIRDSLRNVGMQCVVVGSRKVRDFPEALLAFVFVKSEDQLNTASVRCGKLPILAVDESGSRIYNKDVVFYDRDKYSEYECFIFSCLNERYGLRPNTYSYGNLSITNGNAVYGFNRIKLTITEQRILLFLVVCKGKWIPENNIRDVCFDNDLKSSAVSVHICNINRKFKRNMGSKVIRCKRGLGYMLEENI